MAETIGINARGGIAKEGRKGFDFTPKKTYDVLTSENLTESPSFDFPEFAPSVGVDGELARFEGQTDQFTKDLEARRNRLQEMETDSFSSYLNASLNTPTESGLESAVYGREGGVDDLQTELDDINSQIMSEQRALQVQLRRLDENNQGLSFGALDDEKQRVRGESLERQADLAIIQMSRQGRYDSAKAIADRAIDAQMEYFEKRNEVFKTMYERNKEMFTTAEKRAFESAQQDRDNAFELFKEEKKQISDLSISALEGGAPAAVASQMRSAESVAEAIGIGGGYIGALERAKASASIAASNLQARKALLDLAKAGDPDAIQRLGYDPSDLPLKTTDIVKNEEEYVRIGQDVSRIDRLLANQVGLATSAGVMQNSVISGLFGRGEGPNPKNAFGVPVVGNVTGAVTAYSDKQDFLTGASYVIDNLTFDKLLKLKAEGATFGALSDNELRTIGNAAGELSAMAIKEEGSLVGFRGSEQKVREQLRVVREGMYKAQDKLNADLGLSASDRNEIINTFYGSN